MASLDLSALTLTQLRYLDAVERLRSFRLAADHCRVTQPALSMQVQKLEELLGFSLFDRSLSPVSPTARGEQVIVQARAVLREVARLAELVAAGESGLAGRYRLGVIPTLISSLVPPLLREFARRFPQAELCVEELKTDQLLRRLLDGTLQAGIAATPLNVSGVQEMPLLCEELVIYLSPNHALASREVLEQADLAGQRPWLLSEGHCFRTQSLAVCPGECSLESQHGQLRFEGENFDTLIRIVDEGMGFTLLPELVARGFSEERRRAQVRPFVAPAPAREVSLLTSRQEASGLAAKAVASCVRESIAIGPKSTTRVLEPLHTPFDGAALHKQS